MATATRRSSSAQPQPAAIASKPKRARTTTQPNGTALLQRAVAAKRVGAVPPIKAKISPKTITIKKVAAKTVHAAPFPRTQTANKAKSVALPPATRDRLTPKAANLSSRELNVRTENCVLALSAKFQVTETVIVEALEKIASQIVGTNPTSGLTENDIAVLKQTGSYVPEATPEEELASIQSELEITAIMNGALTVEQTGELLQVSGSRIRQKIKARAIMAVHSGGTWLVPRFQFVANAEIRGFAQVLHAMPENVHPFVVERYLSKPSVNLVIEDEIVSPRTWLTHGGSVDTVVELTLDAFQRR